MERVPLVEFPLDDRNMPRSKPSPLLEQIVSPCAVINRQTVLR
jgi:hypothetical protein